MEETKSCKDFYFRRPSTMDGLMLKLGLFDVNLGAFAHEAQPEGGGAAALLNGSDMATPLHHDHPQRPLQTLKSHREKQSEYGNGSRNGKKTTPPSLLHDENPVESLESVRIKNALRVYYYKQKQQENLRNRRSGSPHVTLEETSRCILNFAPGDVPSHNDTALASCSFRDDDYSHARPDRWDCQNTGSYGTQNDQGSGHIDADEAHCLSGYLQGGSQAVLVIDKYAESVQGRGEQCQKPQSLLSLNPHHHDHRVTLSQVDKESLALKHHHYVNHDNYFGSVDEGQSVSKILGEVPTVQKPEALTAEKGNTTGHNSHLFPINTQKTEKLCQNVLSTAEHSSSEIQEDLDAELGEHVDNSFQRKHSGLSRCSSDDSFCHISKESVEQDLQIDYHLSSSSDQQQWSLGLVYEYSQAGVTFNDEDLSVMRSDTINSVCDDTGAVSENEGNGCTAKTVQDDAAGLDAQCGDVESPPLFLGFCPFAMSFACGTSKGLHVYDIKSARETCSCMIGGVGIVQLLTGTDLLIIVGGGPNPSFPVNRVVIWDSAKAKSIRHFNFDFPVRMIKAMKDLLVVVLDHEICVFNIQNANGLVQFNTTLNPKGLCALSVEQGPSLLACPGLKKGEVRITPIGPSTGGESVDRDDIFIAAHDSSLACVELNVNGTLLATASDRGTLVRIFSTKDGVPLQELRRGSDKAQIYSLAFSFSSNWLAVSSDKGTIHVFSIGSRSNDTNGASSVSVRNPGSTLSFMKGMLPKYFRSEWSYAQFKLPEEMKSVVAFGQEKHVVYVLVTDGSLHRYEFDSEHGGDMKLLECWSFMNSKESEL
ncbi:hypothetical protein KP509_25G010500 [Ceratopteris richardii]|uniref:Uncharacterized protein n=2 Tax=Ceratopteris richardii TaxID=49495 RepID=A0A8T2RMU2_CERRI|nr:hypothetical protein KP509_25G010500 [Ceratopteris richardii]